MYSVRFHVSGRIHALEELEHVAVGGQDQRGAVGDDGFIALHGAGEIVKPRGLGALVVGVGIDFRRFCVGHATNFLDLPVGFRLDLVQIAHPVSADPGRFAVAF